MKKPSSQSKVRKSGPYKVNSPYDPMGVNVDIMEKFMQKSPNDDRLPMALVTEKEHQRLRELAELAVKDRVEHPEKYVKGAVISSPENVMFTVNEELVAINERLKDIGKEGFCCLCGRERVDNKRYEVCPHCLRTLRSNQIRGCSNTRGYASINQSCEVCGKTPIAFKGLCSRCYRVRERLKTDDIAEITKARFATSVNHILAGEDNCDTTPSNPVSWDLDFIERATTSQD